VLLLFALCSCGYQFVGRNSVLPTGGKHIFAPTFANPTGEPGAEALFTEAFREEIANAGAAGDSDSPVIAQGQIANITGGPGLCFSDERFLPPNSAAPRPNPCVRLATYHVDAAVCVSLREGAQTLASTCVSGSEDYPAPQGATDPLQIEAGRHLALGRLAKRLMRQTVEQLSTGF
jgi:hypothetical protein